MLSQAIVAPGRAFLQLQPCCMFASVVTASSRCMLASSSQRESKPALACRKRFALTLAASIHRSFGSDAGDKKADEAEPTKDTTTTTTVKPVLTSAASVEEEEEISSSIDMKPKEIVAELDRYIVGQNDAKRSVAIAIRNRWRRHRVPAAMKDEIMPKNILMIGPTGVGKTEIARRVAKLADFPFVKVEATKFTEVGFHGRDVDQIIRDLVDASIQNTKHVRKKRLLPKLEKVVEDAIMKALLGASADKGTVTTFRDQLRAGRLEHNMIEVDVPLQEMNEPAVGIAGQDNRDLFSSIRRMMGQQRRYEKRRMAIKDARPIIEELETEKLVMTDDIVREAIQSAEQDGIVFIDEIDKICTRTHDRSSSADASAEGVQRDLLPLIEGSTISTKHGNVNTDHILFIASGAFHSCKPSDMLAELQGRLPIRVELKALTEHDLLRILKEPENNLITQQRALLETEGVKLEFSDETLKAISRVAAEVNHTVENIGARRLHTIIERIVDDISFEAPELEGQTIEVTPDMVKDKVGDLLLKTDLSRYVL